jgi:hypothetical protein
VTTPTIARQTTTATRRRRGESAELGLDMAVRAIHLVPQPALSGLREGRHSDERQSRRSTSRRGPIGAASGPEKGQRQNSRRDENLSGQRDRRNERRIQNRPASLGKQLATQLANRLAYTPSRIRTGDLLRERQGRRSRRVTTQGDESPAITRVWGASGGEASTAAGSPLSDVWATIGPGRKEHARRAARWRLLSGCGPIR